MESEVILVKGEKKKRLWKTMDGRLLNHKGELNPDFVSMREATEQGWKIDSQVIRFSMQPSEPKRRLLLHA